MTYQPPTPAQSLAEARSDIADAWDAAEQGDQDRQTQYARAGVDAAAQAIVDPNATRREVVAGRHYLREGLGLDGRANDSIDPEQEARGLSDEDRQWLDNYLNQRRQPAAQPRADIGLGL